MLLANTQSELLVSFRFLISLIPMIILLIVHGPLGMVFHLFPLKPVTYPTYSFFVLCRPVSCSQILVCLVINIGAFAPPVCSSVSLSISLLWLSLCPPVSLERTLCSYKKRDFHPHYASVVVSVILTTFRRLQLSNWPHLPFLGPVTPWTVIHIWPRMPLQLLAVPFKLGTV